MTNLEKKVNDHKNITAIAQKKTRLRPTKIRTEHKTPPLNIMLSADILVLPFFVRYFYFYRK